MKKKEFCKIIASDSRVPIKSAYIVLNSILKNIGKSLANNENVSITKFGTFMVRNRSSRYGINPITKKKIKIKASKVISFKASKILKNKCN